MRILIAANHVPFIRGGAELHVANLAHALRRAGHDIETLRLPFSFSPDSDIHRAMAHASSLDMRAPSGQRIDRLISLQFPAWGIQHDDHWVWVMHQHRAAYELAMLQPQTECFRQLQSAVQVFDNRTLGTVRARFANSVRVAERLHQYNGLRALPLLHPPPGAEHLYAAESLGYVFFPSRLEALKRQSLVIEAAARMRSPLKLLLAGEGGQHEQLSARIEALGVGDRVRLIGRLSDHDMRAFYAHALAVIFPPLDEDYGYITLEAMLSSRAVVTCTDSGGPLTFVRHEETGWIESPDADALAARLDWLHAHPAQVAEAGHRARESVLALGLSWSRVVTALTADAPPAGAV